MSGHAQIKKSCFRGANMDAKTCIKKLSYVGVLEFATVGENGLPEVKCISAIHFGEESFYFLTARGKGFYLELVENGNVQILAYTMYKEMIRVSATKFRKSAVSRFGLSSLTWRTSTRTGRARFLKRLKREAVLSRL